MRFQQLLILQNFHRQPIRDDLSISRPVYNSKASRKRSSISFLSAAVSAPMRRMTLRGSVRTSPRWWGIQFPPVVVDGIFVVVPDAPERILRQERPTLPLRAGFEKVGQTEKNVQRFFDKLIFAQGLDVSQAAEVIGALGGYADAFFDKGCVTHKHLLLWQSLITDHCSLITVYCSLFTDH